MHPCNKYYIFGPHGLRAHLEGTSIQQRDTEGARIPDQIAESTRGICARLVLLVSQQRHQGAHRRCQGAVQGAIVEACTV